MRILSPASEESTLPSPRNEIRKEDSSPKTAKNVNITATTPNGTSSVPTVVLDTDIVSDNMAARLCISFLGHILFLKNQVPFPIVQLARTPTSDNRAAKKRHELLNSFDTLSSQLYTTFIALSTALALWGSPDRTQVGADAFIRHHLKRGVARVFFAVAFGPTVGTAKSHVIVGIDGLETKVWGLREDDKALRTRDVTEEEVNDCVENASEEDEDERSEDEDSEDSDNEEEEDASGSDDDKFPPPSRSPSPVLSSDSDSLLLKEPVKSPQRAEDPETVRAAERLLSRTLASACAEDDGQELVSEMAPTQIHVLLRAPRRFDHPSWVPRQNLCTSLDSNLADFLVQSGQTLTSCDTTRKKRTKASKVQGVWVKSRGSCTKIEDSEQDLAEEDELIWWSWDGKLVGFADW